MSLQFLSDDAGNKTAVVIPIAEWEHILDTHKDLKKMANPSHKEKKVKPSDFKGIFSKEEAVDFQVYLTKVRKEWDRNIY